jgi:hypothetical protein
MITSYDTPRSGAFSWISKASIVTRFLKYLNHRLQIGQLILWGLRLSAPSMGMTYAMVMMRSDVVDSQAYRISSQKLGQSAMLYVDRVLIAGTI